MSKSELDQEKISKKQSFAERLKEKRGNTDNNNNGDSVALSRVEKMKKEKEEKDKNKAYKFDKPSSFQARMDLDPANVFLVTGKDNVQKKDAFHFLIVKRPLQKQFLKAVNSGTVDVAHYSNRILMSEWGKPGEEHNHHAKILLDILIYESDKKYYEIFSILADESGDNLTIVLKHIRFQFEKYVPVYLYYILKHISLLQITTAQNVLSMCKRHNSTKLEKIAIYLYKNKDTRDLHTSLVKLLS